MISSSENIEIDANHLAQSEVVSPWSRIFALLIISGLILLVGQYTNKQQNFQIPVNSVAANNDLKPKPIRIKISSLNIDAPMVDLGLNRDGTLQVPQKGSDVGWYTGSPTPGSIGPSVLVGHLDSIFGKEVFYNLKNIKPGDEIVVTRADNSTATFRVDNMETYSQDNFPTDKVYGPINFAGIRLITCSGTYSRLKGHYSDNLVVYGTLVKVSQN